MKEKQAYEVIPLCVCVCVCVCVCFDLCGNFQFLSQLIRYYRTVVRMLFCRKPPQIKLPSFCVRGLCYLSVLFPLEHMYVIRLLTNPHVRGSYSCIKNFPSETVLIHFSAYVRTTYFLQNVRIKLMFIYKKYCKYQPIISNHIHIID
jgi:hypothetical protein